MLIAINKSETHYVLEITLPFIREYCIGFHMGYRVCNMPRCILIRYILCLKTSVYAQEMAQPLLSHNQSQPEEELLHSRLHLRGFIVFV